MEVCIIMISNIDLDKRSIKKRIAGKGSKKSIYTMTLISDVLNLDEVKIVAQRLNREYSSTRGHPAFDRLMLIGVELFCRSKKISTYTGIADELMDNSVLIAFVDDNPPKYTVISTFMKAINEVWIKHIFYRHLVLANEYDPLNFDKVFIDGTDVIANASINYTINQKQVNATRLLYQFDILHDGSPEGIETTITALKEKLIEYQQYQGICDLIKIALKRPQIYTYLTYERLERIQKSLDETGAKSVSISFPEGIILKTKRGKFDIGFNLQMLMLSNHFVLAGYLLREPNDEDVIDFILNQLKIDIQIFLSLMKKYDPENEKINELENLLDRVTFICDSGYFTDSNIEACIIEGVELIVMSKQVARQENNKKRENWYRKICDIKNHKSDKVTKYLCIRVEDGYLCPFNRLIKKVREYKTKSKYNDKNRVDESLYEFCFIHECEDCTGCPYVAKYGKKCDCARIDDRVSKRKYELTTQFVKGEYKDIYKDRLPISERINAFLKGLNGIYHVKGRDYHSAQIQIILACLWNNMVHLERIKDTYHW